MKCFVYVLRSYNDNSFYTGISYDPERRLKDHNQGGSKYTKGKRPYSLIYIKKFEDRPSARRHEKYLKSGVGREYLKRLFPCSSVGRAVGCEQNAASTGNRG